MISNYNFVFSVCEYQLDLAFIVDSSYNIPNKIDWQLVKLWVLDITNIISVIGPAGVLVSCFICYCPHKNKFHCLFSLSF